MRKKKMGFSSRKTQLESNWRTGEKAEASPVLQFSTLYRGENWSGEPNGHFRASPVLKRTGENWGQDPGWPRPNWDLADWQVAFDEEAARLEYDERLPRDQAKTLARQWVIVRHGHDKWLVLRACDDRR
jgi:hypothetical protein